MDLRGRKVNLKAYMTVDEMVEQLRENEKHWIEEGFGREEIVSAQNNKVRPLIYGFYWHRFPDAQERAKEAWKLYSGQEISTKVNRTSTPKTERRTIKADRNHDFMAQFA